jgi:hypothetical protein
MEERIMRKSTIILVVFLLSFIFSLTAFADCRGCCSWHGGVCCIDGVTMCCDGSPLSSKCRAKGCNKCYGYRPDKLLFDTVDGEICWDELQETEIIKTLPDIKTDA